MICGRGKRYYELQVLHYSVGGFDRQGFGLGADSWYLMASHDIQSAAIFGKISRNCYFIKFHGIPVFYVVIVTNAMCAFNISSLNVAINIA